MYLAVYLPLLFSAVFGLVAPRVAGRLPPALGTWLLSGGGLVAAGASTISLALLGSTLVDQNAFLAASGHWSRAALARVNPVWTPVAAAAAITFVAILVRVILTVMRQSCAVWGAYRLARALPRAGGELAVVDCVARTALAVPGHPGRIVISTGLLRTLNADERRSVLAHERAHLAHHHYLHHTVVRLAVAANPLLRGLLGAVALSTERWADEDAARVCARNTVAMALTRAITSLPALARPGVVLSAAATDVLTRIQALHTAPPRFVAWRAVLLLGLLSAIVATVVHAAYDNDQLFDFARFAYRPR